MKEVKLKCVEKIVDVINVIKNVDVIDVIKNVDVIDLNHVVEKSLDMNLMKEKVVEKILDMNMEKTLDMTIEKIIDQKEILAIQIIMNGKIMNMIEEIVDLYL